jgi:putative FmdB family regulatory protein
MPLYEYECEECGEVFSELRSSAEREAPIVCPRCGGEARVLISAFAPGRSAAKSPAGRLPGACSTGST